MKRWQALTLAGSILASLAGAAGAEDPAEADSELPLGTRVRVRVEKARATALGTEVEGRLVEATPHSYVVSRRIDERRVTVPRDAIERLEVSRGVSRGKPAAIGAGIGLLLGLGLTTLFAVTTPADSYVSGGDMAPLIIPVATAAGAGLGALSAQERWEEIPPDRPPRVTVAPMLGRKGVGLRLVLSF